MPQGPYSRPANRTRKEYYNYGKDNVKTKGTGQAPDLGQLSQYREEQAKTDMRLANPPNRAPVPKRFHGKREP